MCVCFLLAVSCVGADRISLARPASGCQQRSGVCWRLQAKAVLPWLHDLFAQPTATHANHAVTFHGGYGQACLWTSGRAASSAAPPTMARGPTCCTTQYGTIHGAGHKHTNRGAGTYAQLATAACPGATLWRTPLCPPTWCPARHCCCSTPQRRPGLCSMRPLIGPCHAAVDSSNKPGCSSLGRSTNRSTIAAG
jgi:hypothetical protein